MRLLTWVAIAVAALSCQKNGTSDSDQTTRVELEMKQLLAQQIDVWLSASRDLYAAAPTPSGRGWDPQGDAAQIAAMRQAWHRARVAYELVEGAIAPLFPESDTATDARYDDYLAVLGPAGDAASFDDQGVVGMHGIERILWANETPSEVVAFERGLPGYRSANFPRNEADAASFKNRMAKRLVTDVEKLKMELEPVRLDLAFAFHGLVDLAGEQVEKVNRASTGQEESRYAQATLRDLRANRDGCLAAYRIFRPWVLVHEGGAPIDDSVMKGFERLKTAYDAIPGDAIPRPPATWSAFAPSPQDLGSPFGRLYIAVRDESEEGRRGSLRAALSQVADLLGLPKVLLR